MKTFTGRSRPAKRLLQIAFIPLVVGIALLAFPANPVDALLVNLVHTTAVQFNTGTFYRTGLTTKTTGGGDGNGEVRLMTVGISSDEWRSDGNVTNLAPLLGHAAAYKNGRIYVSGGASNDWGLGTRWVSYTTILSTTVVNGTTHNLSDWVGTSSLNVDTFNHGMVAVGNYMYIIGGFVGNFVPQSTVYYAPINSNGSLGTWQTTTSLNQARANFATVVVSDTIYVIGGFGLGATSTVYYAKPQANGTISGWATAAPLPTPPRERLSAAAFGGKIYVVGGTDNANYPSEVYFATPDGTGNIASWQLGSTTIENNLINAAGVGFGGQIYFAGGANNNGTTLTNTVASNLLNDDGSPAGWSYSFVLSTPRQSAAAVVSDDGWLYVIEGNAGGQAGLIPLHSIDYGPLSGGGKNYATNGRYESSIIDLGGSYPVSKIDWNTFVSSTVTMTLQYRLGDSPDLAGVGWSTSAFPAINNAASVTNTVNFGPTSARYIQYRTFLTTTNTLHTPVLNAVAIWYDKPLFPDLIVTNIQAPAASQSTQVLDIPVTIKNTGDYALFPSQPYAPQPGQPARQPQMKVLRNGMRVPAAGPFLYVLVYVLAPGAQAPASIPSNTANGSCYGTTQSRLDPNQTGIVLINFTLPSGSGCSVPSGTHDFYAQVDICAGNEDLAEYPNCTTIGHVQEKSEANNVSGVFPSGSGGGDGRINYLPFIKK